MLNMNNKINSIAKLHNLYLKDIIGKRIAKKEEVLANSKEALLFIISYCMYQGRNDTLSEKFEKITIDSINNKWNNKLLFDEEINVISNSKKEIKESNLEFYNDLKNRGLNKKNDRIMIIHLLNKIQTLKKYDYNIVKYIILCIKDGRLKNIYDELDDIFSFGPKICSLILRDIVIIFNLEDNISDEEYYLLQPIDTWVFQISTKLDLIDNKDKSIDHIKHSKLICNKCLEYKINPIEFNQGVWYLGKHSLDIIFDNIECINKY